MYKKVKAILLGTIGTSIGIVHFDPKRDDEDGRYQRHILPEADAVRAKNRGLVEIVDDATEAEFKAQQLGVVVPPSRISESALSAIKSSEDEESAALAGGAASATANLRNYQPGQGPQATSGDVDAAPLPGESGGQGGQPPALENLLTLPVNKLTEELKKIDDVATLEALHAAEEKAEKPRASALEAIDARKAELTPGT